MPTIPATTSQPPAPGPSDDATPPLTTTVPLAEPPIDKAPSTPSKTKPKRGTTTSSPSTPKSNKRARKDTSSPSGGFGAHHSPAAPSTKVPTAAVDWTQVEGVTPEKKAAIINRVFSEGVAAAGVANLAKGFGLNHIAMRDALAPNRKGNLRDRAMKAVLL